MNRIVCLLLIRYLLFLSPAITECPLHVYRADGQLVGVMLMPATPIP